MVLLRGLMCAAHVAEREVLEALPVIAVRETGNQREGLLEERHRSWRVPQRLGERVVVQPSRLRLIALRVQGRGLLAGSPY